MTKSRAYCIHCDSEGTLGEPCGTPACQQAGYAFIPSEYYVPLKDRPKAVVDHWIGRPLGHYLLVERLSRSAFGRVYLALQRPIWMKAAVKVLDPIDREGVDRSLLTEKFLAEARALGSLNHPNIVRLLYYGGDSDPAYLVMEYVEGVETLGDALERARQKGERTLGPAVSRRILEQILWALSASHAQGIVHLDMSPDNVALTEPIGYRNFIRLLDWGLASQVGQNQGDEVPIGRVEYIAPERLAGRPAGAASDLYAVAVMAFELLAGRSIFRGFDLDTVTEKKQDPEFNPAETLSELRYPPFVIRFFATALAHNPEERYRDAEEFLARLRPVIAFFEE